MTRPTRSDRTRQLAGLAPVIPVLVIPDAGLAADLGRTLIGAGLPVLEVTLRTDGAFDAIRAMADLPGGHVGAGTVLTADDARRARDNGATFAVSPGLTDAIVAACDEIGLPLLPGVATASEAMAAREYGFDMLKLFPAEGATPAVLKAQRAVLPKEVPVLVVGGVQPDTMRPWLDAGANGFGLGSGLYAPGRSADEVHQRALAYVAGCKA